MMNFYTNRSHRLIWISMVLISLLLTQANQSRQNFPQPEIETEQFKSETNPSIPTPSSGSDLCTFTENDCNTTKDTIAANDKAALPTENTLAGLRQYGLDPLWMGIIIVTIVFFLAFIGIYILKDRRNNPGRENIKVPIEADNN